MCDDKPLRDEYGNLMKDKNGKEIIFCKYIGGGETETDGRFIKVLAIVLSCLGVFLTVCIITCYFRGKGKCCDCCYGKKK